MERRCVAAFRRKSCPGIRRRQSHEDEEEWRQGRERPEVIIDALEPGSRIDREEGPQTQYRGRLQTGAEPTTPGPARQECNGAGQEEQQIQPDEAGSRIVERVGQLIATHTHQIGEALVFASLDKDKRQAERS